MEAKTLPVSSLNDIVFEGRNKAYGAYVLRQNYNQELTKAAGISFSSVLLLLAGLYVAVQAGSEAIEAQPDLEKDKRVNEIILEPNIPKELKAEPAMGTAAEALPKEVKTSVATKDFRNIKIVSDLTPVDDIIPDQSDFAQAEPGLVTQTGAMPGTTAPEMGVLGEGTAGTNTDTEAPFLSVEQMPEFPDGLAAMYRFISKNLRYPSEAQARGLEGAVVVTFVVSATGQISNIQVIQDIGGGAAAEAERVIKKMPNWHPGRQNNRAVPVRFTLPIKFKLN